MARGPRSSWSPASRRASSSINPKSSRRVTSRSAWMPCTASHRRSGKPPCGFFNNRSKKRRVKMKIYKIRVTADVLETTNATRRVTVDGQVLTFGLEPVYVRAAELPPQLADDRYLRIESVDSAPPDMEVIELLKPERVQDPTPASVPATRKK